MEDTYVHIDSQDVTTSNASSQFVAQTGICGHNGLRHEGVSQEDYRAWYRRLQDLDLTCIFPVKAMVLDEFVKGQVFDEVNADTLCRNWDESVPQYLTKDEVVGDVCRRCRSLLGRYNTSSNEQRNILQPHKQAYTTAQLSAGTRLGCSFCRLMMSTLQMFRYFDLIRKIEQRLVCLLRRHPKVIRLEAVGYNNKRSFHLVIGGWSRNARAWISTFDTQTVHHRAQLIEPTSRAKQWLQTCVESHSCSSRYQRLRLPTRLVSIGSRLKLVETSSLKSRPEYATVSYCWGQGNNLKLTELSYDQFRDEIPYDNLPPTIYDAIGVAYNLGLNWIWVDALCILQDQPDHQDWRSEAAIMGDIYGGGCINLAASTSTDVRQGACNKPEGYIAGFDTHMLFGHLTHVYLRNAWALAVTESHLSQRGWAFQERLLAPRTLYMTCLGFFWECAEHRGAEHAPDGFRHEHYLVDDLCLGRRRAWNWKELVQRYSMAKLSYQNDRLVAISGLAKCQQAITRDVYLAGMWQSSLEAQLTWYVTTAEPRTQAWAPTWSWTSVDGAVAFAAVSGMSTMATVTSASTQLIGSDAFGEISSGTLSLACKWLLQTRLDKNERVLRCGNGVTTKFSLDCSEDGLLRDGEFAYLLPIMALERPDFPEMHSLVLQSCGHGNLRRIGFHLTMVQHKTSTDFAALKELLEEEGERTAATVCHERGQDGRYVVTVV